jgi:hypothetical protein
VNFCSEDRFLYKAKKIIEEKFGTKCKIYRDKRTGVGNLYNNRALSIIFKKIMENTNWILQLPLSKLKYFLYGWWQGDGYHNKKWKKYGIVVTTSEKYKDFLSDVFLRFGIIVSISKNNETYMLRASKVNLNILEWDKGVNQKIMAKKLGDLVLVKIKNIKRFNYSGFVYDFSIKGYENFIANGVCCHNTREEIGDLIDDITPTGWKKPISPTSQMKYSQEFLKVDGHTEGHVNLGNVSRINLNEIQPIEVKFPKIRTPMKSPEVTLRDAEGGAVGMEEEEELLEEEENA